MSNKSDKEIVYKEQITSLLLMLLQIAGRDTQYEKDFEEAYRKRLKFKSQTEWKRFRASIDLLDDTEYAIMSAFEYQLGDLKNKNRDIGERYLRLYGILNAVYLQKEAYIQIANLLNYPKRDTLKDTFNKLDIIKLRNIAGSHTVNFDYDKQTVQSNPGINKRTSFRIVQMYLEKTGSKITAVDENNISFEFNLLDILTEYDKIATDLLIKLIHHSIKELVYKKEDKIEIKKRLEERLPNLIDYSKINKNKEHKVRQKKKLEKILQDTEKTLSEFTLADFQDLLFPHTKP